MFYSAQGILEIKKKNRGALRVNGFRVEGGKRACERSLQAEGGFLGGGLCSERLAWLEFQSGILMMCGVGPQVSPTVIWPQEWLHLCLFGSPEEPRPCLCLLPLGLWGGVQK